MDTENEGLMNSIEIWHLFNLFYDSSLKESLDELEDLSFTIIGHNEDWDVIMKQKVNISFENSIPGI